MIKVIEKGVKMKRILIYGDSNLWGFNFIENKRLDDKYQWANMLKEYLGPEYNIIQEGLPGRVAGNIDNKKLYKNGKASFDAIYRSCTPVDYIIIALGTNDLSIEYDRTAHDIYNDLMWYKERVKEIYSDLVYKQRYFNEFPKFIYVLPGNFDYLNDAKDFYDLSREEERQKLIKIFKDNNLEIYVELNNIELIKGDGIHYSTKGQQQVFEEVKKIF